MRFKIFRKRSNFNFHSQKYNFEELRRRLFFVIFSLIVFRVGSFIPIPGIDLSILSIFLENEKGTIIEMFNMFSGGALSRASIFALGIMPYISSSIIIQLLTMISSKLSEIKKEGESGRYKISQYTRYLTLFLSFVQSIGITISIPNFQNGLVINLNFWFYFNSIISLVTGTMFLMWLSERITEKGIGNGTSIIIFAGIVAGLFPSIIQTLERFRQGYLGLTTLFLILIFVIFIIFFIVFIEKGQRKIVVNYAKRQQGRRLYSIHNTHLPLKINMSGVIPAIFASSIILFPGTVLSWFVKGKNCSLYFNKILMFLKPGELFYILIYASAIIFFCFFYTNLVFSSKETADNLKKSGAYISGIRPGEQTAKYIQKIMNRLILIGAVYITLICLIPEFVRNFTNFPFYFGGTSLLIVIVIIMDFISQIQTIIISSQYDSIIRKSNFKSNKF